jgi:hypothetical protein
MSQHDFNIANQTFPSFRSDLNDALQAAATMSAGASAPTTPYAYQLWFDTTTGTWKVRNSGNSAWISTITTDLATGNVGIGTSSPGGRLVVADPGTAVPTAGYGTGLMVARADGLIGLAIGDIGSGNASYLQAKNFTNTDTKPIALNPSGGNVGIGTTSPSVGGAYSANNTLTIFGGTNSGSEDTAYLEIGSSTNVNGYQTGGIAFYNDDNSGAGATTRKQTAIIRALSVTSDSNAGDDSGGVLQFLTKSEAGSVEESLRITSAGKVGIGSFSGLTNILRVASDNPTAYFDAQLELYSDAGNIMQSFHAGGSSVVTLKHVRGVDGIEVRDLNGTTYKEIRASAFTVNSDYRLKENIVPLENATERLKQIPVHRFNFKSIEETGEGFGDATVDGFLAHEVQTVVPEAISGTHNGMRDEEYTVSAATGDIYTPAIDAVLDEDGNEVTPAVAEVIHSTDVERPEELAKGQQWRETTAAVMGTRSVPDYQGIDQSKLVPLLVKTIQELEARITALEA